MNVPPAGKPRVLQCPNCGGAISLRAAGHSIQAVCSQCNTLLDTAREEIKIIKKSQQHQQQPLIPLGSRGHLQGVLWEVIGYLRKSSGEGLSERYFWDEYLLFNPWQGFRFLSEAQGHWTLYRNLKTLDKTPDAHDYALFFRGDAKVDYVLGEFYWRVKQGDSAQITDSIQPPYVLSVEKSRDESVVSFGEYVPATEIAAAFDLPETKLPPIKGIAANQPSPFAWRLPGVLKTSALVLALSFATVLIQVNLAREQLLVHEVLAINPANRDASTLSKSFHISPRQTNLCIQSHAELNNNWAELELGLINQANGQRRNLTLGMERYSGYDGGEHWREGSNTATGCFAAVEPGEYQLIAHTDAGDLGWNNDNTQQIQYSAFQDVPIWSNWLALLLALLPYPLYLLLRHHSFEYARWSESDHMPATYASIQHSLKGEDDV